MSPLVRWLKFNLVGALGMLLQLAILALLNQWTEVNYLLATAVAIELTLLHNFVWHLHYTWRDRQQHVSQRLSQLIRFHLSNGLVSMLGNLVFMRILVEEMEVPVLISSCIAILFCSIVNFWLGNNWAFEVKA